MSYATNVFNLFEMSFLSFFRTELRINDNDPGISLDEELVP